MLLFALAVSLLTGLIFGALPALRSLRTLPMETLKSAGRGNTEGRGGLRTRNVLVSLEVGLSAALLVTAGLLIASFTRLMSVDKGFQVDRVLAVNVSMLSTRYPKPEDRNAFFQRVLEKAAALPGVQKASLVSALPLTGETWIDIVSKEHDTRPTVELPNTNVRFVSPGYFETLRVALARGRDFEERDRSQQGGDRLRQPGAARMGQRRSHRPQAHGQRHGDGSGRRHARFPQHQSRQRARQHALHPVLAASATGRRDAAAHVDGPARHRQCPAHGRLGISTARSPFPRSARLRKCSTARWERAAFNCCWWSLFAAAALALAAFGTYGVLSYAVARRTGELGIRMALGAQRADVLQMVLRQGMMPVFFGLAAGGAAALALGRYLESLLFEVSPRDPAAFVISGAVLLAASVAACLIPARRATKVSPLEALRFE